MSGGSADGIASGGAARGPGVISVLLVDDHPVVRQGLRALLEVQDGIVVAGEAGDGPTAVSLATSLRPDIVLLDLKLPGMDGIAVLESLRSSGLRALVLTSATEPSAAARAVRAGAAASSTRTSTRTPWSGPSARCGTATCCSHRRHSARWSAAPGPTR